jgi:hypothetical protein
MNVSVPLSIKINELEKLLDNLLPTPGRYSITSGEEIQVFPNQEIFVNTKEIGHITYLPLDLAPIFSKS